MAPVITEPQAQGVHVMPTPPPMCRSTSDLMLASLDRDGALIHRATLQESAALMGLA